MAPHSEFESLSQSTTEKHNRTASLYQTDAGNFRTCTTQLKLLVFRGQSTGPLSAAHGMRYAGSPRRRRGFDDSQDEGATVRVEIAQSRCVSDLIGRRRSRAVSTVHVYHLHFKRCVGLLSKGLECITCLTTRVPRKRPYYLWDVDC